MAAQFSTAVRNARADITESTIGTAPTLELRTGAPPANCAAADSGTVLASMTLPSDWLSNASGGAKSLLGTWEDASADATGTAGHFRIKAGATCHMQGIVSATGGGGDLTFINPAFVATQPIGIGTFTLTEGNA